LVAHVHPHNTPRGGALGRPDDDDDDEIEGDYVSGETATTGSAG
jgi:hypothetical protein